jgi:metallophosphoesterase superfamily enzyme
MFYVLLKTKAKMRSLNAHNKDMDNCCLTIVGHKHCICTFRDGLKCVVVRPAF